MGTLYVNDNGLIIGINDGRYEVRKADEVISSYPINTTEAIVILGNSQLTCQAMQLCLKNSVPVSFYSKTGRYYGKIVTTQKINASRLRKQCLIENSEFAMEMAVKIMFTKINNQIVVLRRYARNSKTDCSKLIRQMDICKRKLSAAKNKYEVMGYEGIAAKQYFKGLATCINPDFCFRGRSKRPPRDEFNAAISFGYTFIHKIIIDEIERKGLSAYIGLIHSDAKGSPALACDLIEEWRATIVDTLVLGMINRKELLKTHFVTNINGACYLNGEGVKILASKLNEKLAIKTKYLEYVSYEVDFRTAITFQVRQFVKAIDNGDAKMYKPFVIR